MLIDEIQWKDRSCEQVSGEKPGILILSEAYYPGWKAKIDNITEIVPVATQGWMRGVPVSAGHHLVEIVFDSWTIKCGLWISLFTVVVCGLLYTDRFRINRDSQPE